MNNFKSSKAIALVTTALFVASLFWLMNTKRVNGSLEAGLEKEKLKSESLLSEKLLLEKDIQKFKDQLFEMKDRNLDLSSLVKSTTAKLERQEADYNRMKKQNLSLAQVKKQRQELIAMQAQLENELQHLRSSYASLEARNNELNSTIALLQEKNKLLSDDLNRAMFASVDQSQIQAVKGKSERLTVRAKKTRKLIANFQLPANLKSLSFRVVDSKGNALTSKEGDTIVELTPSENNFTASSETTPQDNRPQNVLLTYIPKSRLNSGLYTIEILNDNLYVGSLKVKLK
jgi:hypothetical protein